jgi:hypothetical protein
MERAKRTVLSLPRRGRVVGEADRVGIVPPVNPSRRAALADLSLRGRYEVEAEEH